jgi:ATP-grasp domain
MTEPFSFERLGYALELSGLDSLIDAPNVLLAATDRWYPTARLGVALAKAGCTVDAVCPPGHPLGLTRALRRMYRYSGLSPLASMGEAIYEACPDLIVPADDLATRHLHELHKRESRRDGAGRQICELIERSLGAVGGFAIVRARNAFMQVAEEEGIRVPHTAVIQSTSELHEWIARMGFPAVLKANGTSGGDGVRVVNTVQEAERAFYKLQSPPLLARAIKHAVIDRDLTLIRPSLLRRRPVVNAQSFVAGHEATSTLFCWEGNVLASLHFEVLEKAGSTGHATVVRWIDHPEMSEAAEKIARRLKLSGFHGLDFMIETKTGKAHLIEINPRTTQVGHLALGEERDLPAALYAAVTRKSMEPSARVTENDTIALFPQEWKRDPQSPYLSSAYHDVPWQQPGIVSACAREFRKRDAPSIGKPITTKLTSSTAIAEDSAATETQPETMLTDQNRI